MEPEIRNEAEPQEISKNSFNSVTPLSKYLAMVLFIILPFIGAWIGYNYAPEKVMEVEKFIFVEKEVEAETIDSEIRTYINEEYGFEFKYLISHELIEDNSDLNSFLDITIKNNEGENPHFVGVSLSINPVNISDVQGSVDTYASWGEVVMDDECSSEKIGNIESFFCQPPMTPGSTYLIPLSDDIGLYIQGTDEESMELIKSSFKLLK